MGVPEKVVNVIGKLMSRRETRHEVTENCKTTKSRVICIVRGFLHSLTEVLVAMLMEDTDGYMMGQEGERSVKNTQSVCR